MAKTVDLDIITPSGTFFNGACESVIVTTPEGEEGFLADHAWTCLLLTDGPIWVKEAGAKEFRVAFVAGGFLDVKDSLIIFTDAAEWQEDIDVERAAARKAEAEAWLSDTTHGAHKENEVARAQVAIARAVSRMKVAKSLRR